MIAATVLAVGLVRRPFPQTSGELELAGLSGPVEVIRDERGIAHIYADTAEDLFLAQGFVAAQDRFFQMDLRRHIVSGRLAELVGPAGVDTDKVIRTMGWRHVAQEELTLLSPSARSYLQAYASGVNAYIESRRSPSRMSLEYVVLSLSAPGYQVEPWDEVDSLAWLKAMAWDMRGNYSDELDRGRLVGQVSLEELGSLYPPYPADRHAPILSPGEWAPEELPRGDTADSRGGTSGSSSVTPPGEDIDPADRDRIPDPAPPTAPPGASEENWLASGPLRDDGQASPEGEHPPAAVALSQSAAALDAVPALIGRGEGIGSNSWVVSGEHTASGMPLLANDPHLGVSQPSIWQQVGLHCRVVDSECPFDVSGFSFAGYPGVIIGHNQSIAWGFTNMDPDVTDFYLEEVEGELVRRDAGQEPLQIRTETIKVAGGEDVSIEIRQSSHGPILSGIIDDITDLGQSAPLRGVQTSNTYEVALAWTGLIPGTTGEAVFLLNSATNWEEFRDSARAFTVPAQNLIYADREGNIGYQAPGQIPIRRSATHGTPPGYFPTPGWNSSYAWDGFVDFEDMPHVLNPDDGIIVTANQAVIRGDRPFLTSEADKGYRSHRIEVLLDEAIEQRPLTIDAMAQMQLDDHNSFAAALVPYLLQVEMSGDFYTQAQDLLREWDFTAPAQGDQSAAAAYFYAVYVNLLDAVFDDVLPPDLKASGNSRSMLLLEQLLASPDSPWWDDRRTPGVIESRDELIRAALVEARHDLTRQISKDPYDWSWGELHQIRIGHEVLDAEGIPSIIRDLFSQSARPVSGSSAVVNAMNWDASTGTFHVTSAPSMRMVIDLSDFDTARWINHTGNSGHTFHSHATDQTDAWIEGETYPWPFSQAAVQEAGTDVLTLLPE